MREEPSGKNFGTRYLKDESMVFNHNAWDNMPWDESMEAAAKAIVEKQKAAAVVEEKAVQLLEGPADQWDAFYAQHANRFFMDRNWLLKEFPELDTSTLNDGESLRVLEVGCGVGNTTFPILDLDVNRRLFLYSCDYSANAIRVLREQEKYEENRCRAFVWDITEPLREEIPEGSLDIVVCIYVLSAIEPSRAASALSHLLSLLRPGGCLLLKDYGRYDLTQLRFKKDRYIRDNLYCRGDGTLVYFYDSEELDALLSSVGFVKEANVVDRRLIVNRAKRVKMQRNKKALLKLSCEAIKYFSVIHEILDDEEVSSLLEERAVDGDVHYAAVLIYELLLGRGVAGAARGAKTALLRLDAAIRRKEKELAGLGRGLDSITHEKLQRDKAQQLPRYARINTLKWTEEEALKSLVEENWKLKSVADVERYSDVVSSLKYDEVLRDPHVSCLLIFPHDPNFHSYWMVEQRFLILQDKASCLPAFLLNPPKGAQVVDACAAPGMKTSHLAAVLGNTGRVLAMDRSAERVHTMNDLLEASGAENVEVICGDFLRVDVTDKYYSKVEYALVDPPCSGSGIVKRLSEWMDTEADESRLQKLAKLQAMLLKHALRLPSLKRLVYSTCSIHETENEGVVEEALRDVPSFRLVQGVLPEWKERGHESFPFSVSCLRASPKLTLTNGFFVAVFERVEEEKDEESESDKKRKKKRTITTEGEESATRNHRKKKRTRKDTDQE